MAAMSDLLFRGTVDEINVGKLSEGMPASIKIGALPDAKIEGIVYSISLKARTDDNATVFPIEISLTEVQRSEAAGGLFGQCGHYHRSSHGCARDSGARRPLRRRGRTCDGTDARWDHGRNARFETGLSDAINGRSDDGLEEGEEVVEAPPREIS